MVLQISELYTTGMKLYSSTTYFTFFSPQYCIYESLCWCYGYNSFICTAAVLCRFNIPNLFMHFLVSRYLWFFLFFANTASAAVRIVVYTYYIVSVDAAKAVYRVIYYFTSHPPWSRSLPTAHNVRPKFLLVEVINLMGILVFIPIIINEVSYCLMFVDSCVIISDMYIHDFCSFSPHHLDYEFFSYWLSSLCIFDTNPLVIWIVNIVPKFVICLYISL